MFNIMNVGLPSPFFVVAKMNIILDKIKALKLGKIGFQFDPTMITCNVIQVLLHLQQ